MILDIPACSIIIPVLNEAGSIARTLASLAVFRELGCEIILADGGSTDDTLALAQPLVDNCVQSAGGRGLQMNAGARVARAQRLWFLHADTQPLNALSLDQAKALIGALDASDYSGWGFFTIRLSGGERWCRVLSYFINVRSSASGIGTGDQGFFCERALFETLGGYAPIGLMEDVELCGQLKQLGAPKVVKKYCLLTSSRRWREHGLIKTVLLMWWLRLKFWLGVNHRQLSQQYYPRQ